MNVKYGVSEAVSGHTGFSYTLYHSPKKCVSLSDIAHFALRKSPFQGAIWCFLASNIGHFASRNGAFCKTKKYVLNINH